MGAASPYEFSSILNGVNRAARISAITQNTRFGSLGALAIPRHLSISV
jgi:hypothetical protein